MQSLERFRLVDAVLVCPDGIAETDIVIGDERIETIGSDGFSGPTLACGGDYLLPGCVELHTDNLEYHLEPRAGTFLPPAMAVRAHDAELAAAGITTAFNALTLGGDETFTGRPSLLSPALDALARARPDLRCDHQLHLRCEVSDSALPQKLTALAPPMSPSLVSVMDHTPGQGQWRDLAQFRRYYSRRYGLSQSDLDILIERRQAAHHSCARQNRLLTADLARDHRAVLASHDDATADNIAAAIELGCRLSEFPTTQIAARHAHAAGMLVIGGAPNLVRGGSSSGNVAAADLIEQDLLDIVSSDYYPASLLAAVFLLHRDFGVPLAQAVAMASHVPARAAGLTDRGMLAPGLLADLVRVRLDDSGPVVVAVWRRGRRIY